MSRSGPGREGVLRRAVSALALATALAVVAIAPAALAAACGSPQAAPGVASPSARESGAATTSSPSSSPAPTASASTDGMRQVPVGVGSPPLKGTLTLPAGEGPFPAVVLVSGSGPNDQDESAGPNKPFRDLAVGLAQRGVASLRYDKRTHDYPGSVDARTYTAREEYVPDALAGIGLLERRTEVDPERVFLLGHSQGGTLAPLIAKSAPQLAGVILYAAGAEPLGAAMLRQTRYLATLPGTIGAQAEAQLPEVERLATLLDSRGALEQLDPGTPLLGGTGPAYFLSLLDYDAVATARAIPQPLLLLQGGRDYQVTVEDDLRVWRQGLMGRTDVTVVELPRADHLFLDGGGRPTPAEYERPGRVDRAAVTAIARWIRTTSTAAP